MIAVASLSGKNTWLFYRFCIYVCYLAVDLLHYLCIHLVLSRKICQAGAAYNGVLKNARLVRVICQRLAKLYCIFTRLEDDLFLYTQPARRFNGKDDAAGSC